MIKAISKGLLFTVYLTILDIGVSATAFADGVKVMSEKTVSGFKFPESVAYDPQAKVLYVSQFGSELKPTQKDAKGYISKVSLDGEVLEETFLPAPGKTLDKPKGIWVAGDRLWTTDIDVAWVFDLKTKDGRKVALPGAQFANDPTIIGDALYVSDHQGDQLYRIEPADFLNIKGEPKVTRVFSGKSINPNGIYPAADGSLLMVGFKSKEDTRGIYSMNAAGEVKELAAKLGRLDGIYEMTSGDLLITEWNSGSFGTWSAGGGVQTLASGFGGPADLGVAPNADGLLVVVPDLVKSELRIIQLAQ